MMAPWRPPVAWRGVAFRLDSRDGHTPRDQSTTHASVETITTLATQSEGPRTRLGVSLGESDEHSSYSRALPWICLLPRGRKPPPGEGGGNPSKTNTHSGGGGTDVPRRHRSRSVHTISRSEAVTSAGCGLPPVGLGDIQQALAQGVPPPTARGHVPTPSQVVQHDTVQLGHVRP